MSRGAIDLTLYGPEPGIECRDVVVLGGHCKAMAKSACRQCDGIGQALALAKGVLTQIGVSKTAFTSIPHLPRALATVLGSNQCIHSREMSTHAHGSNAVFTTHLLECVNDSGNLQDTSMSLQGTTHPFIHSLSPPCPSRLAYNFVYLFR